MSSLFTRILSQAPNTVGQALQSGRSSRRSNFKRFQEQKRERERQQELEKQAQQQAQQQARQAEQARRAQEAKERSAEQARQRAERRQKAFVQSRENIRQTPRDQLTGIIRRPNESQEAFTARQERVIRASERVNKQSLQRPNISLLAGGVGVSTGSQVLKERQVQKETKKPSNDIINVGEGIDIITAPITITSEKISNKLGGFLEGKGFNIYSTPQAPKTNVISKAITFTGQKAFTPIASRESVGRDLFLGGAIAPSAKTSKFLSQETVRSASRKLRTNQIKGAEIKAVIKTGADIRLRGNVGKARAVSKTKILDTEITSLAELGLKTNNKKVSAVGEAITVSKGKDTIVTASEIATRSEAISTPTKVKNLRLKGTLKTKFKPEDVGVISDSALRNVGARRLKEQNLGLIDTIGESSLSKLRLNLKKTDTLPVSNEIIRTRTGAVARKVRSNVKSNEFNVFSGNRRLRVSRKGSLSATFNPKDIGVIRVSNLPTSKTSDFAINSKVTRQVTRSKSVSAEALSSAVTEASQTAVKSNIREVSARELSKLPTTKLTTKSKVITPQTSLNVRSNKVLKETSLSTGTINKLRLEPISSSKRKNRIITRTVTKQSSLLKAGSLNRQKTKSLTRTGQKTRTKQAFRQRNSLRNNPLRQTPRIPSSIGALPIISLRAFPPPKVRVPKRKKFNEDLFVSPDLTSRALRLTSKTSIPKRALRTDTGLGLRKLPV